jgi:hypothetical protein
MRLPVSEDFFAVAVVVSSRQMNRRRYGTRHGSLIGEVAHAYSKLDQTKRHQTGQSWRWSVGCCHAIQ